VSVVDHSSKGASLHPPGCRCQRCRGFEPRNQAALRHGAFSERQIRPRAANHRRRILRQLRLRAGDLDPIGRGYLDQYVRLQSKLELIDRYVEEHGLLRDDGEPQPRFASTWRWRTAPGWRSAASRII
jgi:hypothetical protein